jgi:transcriptional regulator with XRE-family HTH domain
MLINTIQKWLKRKRASKADLASAIERSRSYVTRLERGDIRPSAEAMFRIAEYFGCPVEDVFQHNADENQTEVFFMSKVLPSGQRINFTSAAAKPVCCVMAAPPARPAGMETAKDRSLVSPAAKVVASLSRSKPNGKT